MRQSFVILITFVLLSSLLAVFTPDMFSLKDSLRNENITYISGDWNVTGLESRTNETIVLTGNLTVHPSGNLTFRNVTLKMNCSFDGEYHIEVLSGGEYYVYDNDNNNITIEDASVITAYNTSNHYLFWVRDGGKMFMKNSELHYCGYHDGYNMPNYGLAIWTDNVLIDHCLISENYQGLYADGSSAIISNNTIINNSWYGMWFKNSPLTVTNNTVTAPNADAIQFQDCSPLIINNSISEAYEGVYGHGAGNNPNLIGNRLKSIKQIGIHVQEGEWALIDNIISDCYGTGGSGVGAEGQGIHLDGGCNAYIENCTISSNSRYGICTNTGKATVINSTLESNGELSFFLYYSTDKVITLNTSFNSSKISIASSSRLTVQNYLHVKIIDNHSYPIQNVDVKVIDINETGYEQIIYASSGFGGSDPKTDSNGMVKWIPVTDRVYKGSNIATENTTRVEISYNGFTFIDNPRDVNMSSSHTEIFSANQALGNITYINEDWNVTGTEVRTNETIVLTGNLTIYSGGNLTFRNVTLKMNCSYNGQYHIEVLGGGEFYIYDNDEDNTTTEDASNITSNTAYRYLFWVRGGAVVIMKSSELHYCGYNGGSLNTYGLYIESDNTTVDHSFISANFYGIHIHRSSPMISNSTIVSNIKWGISCYSAFPIIESNNVSNNAGGIQSSVSSSPTIKNCKVLSNSDDGIFCILSSSATILNSIVENNAFLGVGGTSNSYSIVVNCTIANNGNSDLSLSSSWFTVINSTFNKTKVYFGDAESNLTVKWYLNTKVVDSNNNPLPSANIVVKNVIGEEVYNGTTNLDCYVSWLPCTEYVQNQTTTVYHTPHTICIEKNGITNSTTVYMNESKEVVLTLDLPSVIPTNLSLTATPATLTADSTSASKITVTVTNETGTPSEDIGINFMIESGCGSLLESTNITDINGKASITYQAGTTAEEVVINATNTTYNIWNVTTVTLIPGPVKNIYVSPAGAINLYLGTNQTFGARAYDKFSNLNTSWAPYWHVDGLVGAIDEAGFFTATKKGSGAVNCTDNVTGVYNISIVNVLNSMPIIEPIENQTAYEGQLFTLQIVATDLDNDILTFSDNSTLFSINTTTGLISFTPNYDSAGIYWINITVSDGMDTDWQIFKLEIINVNRLPIPIISSPLNNSTFFTTDNIIFDASNTTDPDNETLTFLWLSNISDIIGNKSKFNATLPEGVHLITFIVNDTHTEITTEITITVKKPTTSVSWIEQPENILTIGVGVGIALICGIAVALLIRKRFF